MFNPFAHEYIKFKMYPGAKMPSAGTQQSAGYDLYAVEEVTITGGAGNFIVKTGVVVELPAGTYGRIAMRSGLAVKEHLAVSAGVIDIDYKGEIGVIVFCTKIGHEYTIKAGERFAQLVPEKVWYGTSKNDGELERADASQRIQVDVNDTHAGFGSTGKF